MKITYVPASTEDDFKGILALQKRNLPESLSKNEMDREGFLTCRHDAGLLKSMNVPYPHMLAKHDGRIIGYVLVMLKEFRERFPVIQPMFVEMEKIRFKGQPIDALKYLILGQVCIDRDFRGMHIFDNLYLQYKASLEPYFDYVITEVASRNLPSLKAHQRVGFEIIHSYTAPNGEGWEVIIWALNGE